jgi:hypothetical protein
MASRGKYAGIIDRLPRFLGTEPPYQEKVEAVKQAKLEEAGGTFLPASTLAKEYEDLRAEVAGIEEQLSEANLRLEACSQMLQTQFEVEGLTSLRLDSGQSVTVQYEPYAKVEDKEAFRQWCLRNGLETSLSLPWMTTNAITKERLLAYEPEPDGVVAQSKYKIVLRKG